MGILKLKPACKDYLWGGNRLIHEYQMEQTGDVLAEAWVLACHRDGASVITNGLYRGSEALVNAIVNNTRRMI